MTLCHDILSYTFWHYTIEWKYSLHSVVVSNLYVLTIPDLVVIITVKSVCLIEWIKFFILIFIYLVTYILSRRSRIRAVRKCYTWYDRLTWHNGIKKNSVERGGEGEGRGKWYTYSGWGQCASLIWSMRYQSWYIDIIRSRS